MKIFAKRISAELMIVALCAALGSAQQKRIAEDSGAKFWMARQLPDGPYEITLSCC
jgi:hypothetical protein